MDNVVMVKIETELQVNMPHCAACADRRKHAPRDGAAVEACPQCRARPIRALMEVLGDGGVLVDLEGPGAAEAVEGMVLHELSEHEIKQITLG